MFIMRLLTSLVVMGVCCFAIVRGWEGIEFVSAENSIDADPSAVDRLHSSADVAGLVGTAQKALLARSGLTMEQREDALTRLLAVRPLASVEWLSLAGARVVSGAPEDRALSALMMSRITGPNEGEAMLRRGLFGLLRWETLPSVVQRQTAHDLAGVILTDTVTADAVRLIRSALAEKTGDARIRIGKMLQAEQVPATRLAQIGL